MIELGGNIYFTAKLGATDGKSFQQLAVGDDRYDATCAAATCAAGETEVPVPESRIRAAASS